MKSHADKQYTIRNVPANVDRALRSRAKESGKSLNEVAVLALTAGAGEVQRPKRDLSFLIGSMNSKEAKKIDAEIDMQRQIDQEIWS